jgi:anaerobic magnesium-protoporphyrin IX monomethyl ester cyclase
MKITLINSDFPSDTAVPPLGVLSLAQFARSRGHEVFVRDFQLAEEAERRDPDTFADFCKNTQDMLGVSVSGFSLPLVILALRKIKNEYPEKLILLGGIGASGAAIQIMNAFPWIDMIVHGEGEHTLVELLECLEKGQEPLHVQGLLYRWKRKVHANPLRPRIKNLADLGKMDFQNTDLGAYQVVNMISSRGCPFPCTFCDVAPYWGNKCVPRPTKYVISEVEEIVNLIQPTPNFIFVDDTLTLDRKRISELCYGLGRGGLQVKWACYARANDLDQNLLSLMAESGCRKIYLGLESGSDEVLCKIKKGFDAETGRQKALLARQYIPIVQTAFVWGFPFETWENFYDTLFIMGHLASKGISIKANVLTPLPFSSLYKQYVNTTVFIPDYSPQLHLAGYTDQKEIIELIKKYPRIFPCFYLYRSKTLTDKYDLLRKMNLSPEHIWDIWENMKGPVPRRQKNMVERP